MNSLFVGRHKDEFVCIGTCITGDRIVVYKRKNCFGPAEGKHEKSLDGFLVHSINYYYFFQIIDWLNECNSAVKTSEKCEALKKIQELMVHSDEELLEEFLENVLAFSHDPVQDVRRCVVAFVEEIS